MRYFIQLAYNGTPFFGWQRQPQQISVQEVIEDCLSKLLHEPIAIVGCGRTDTGVHAKEFYAHFDVAADLEEAACAELVRRLNSFLPKEIVVFKMFAVSAAAHARFDATARTYRYYLNTTKNPFTAALAYPFFLPLDIDKMNEAAAILLRTQDFTSFSKVHTQVNNNICHVTTAFWQRRGEQLVFEITANRFLRNMVRAIVGTLLQVGTGKLSIKDFEAIIERKDRCSAGMSVPAKALFLEQVEFDFKEE